MIQSEFFRTREDGVDLYRAYSDADRMIRKDGTDELYTEAIDTAHSGFTYTETELPVESDLWEPTVQDTLMMLKELGVDTDDQ